MTFKEIQDMVLEASFAEEKRTDAKAWINAAYGGLFDSQEWTFTQTSELVTVTAGSQAVSGIAGVVGAVLSLQRSDGRPLVPVDEYRDFAARYLGTNNTARALPEAYCAVDGAVFVGPTSSVTDAAYLLVYEKAVTVLVADGDIPVIPAHYHVGLVYDAKSAGCALLDQVQSQRYAALAQTTFAPMRQKYLRAMRGTATQAPAWRP